MNPSIKAKRREVLHRLWRIRNAPAGKAVVMLMGGGQRLAIEITDGKALEDIRRAIAAYLKRELADLA